MIIKVADKIYSTCNTFKCMSWEEQDTSREIKHSFNHYLCLKQNVIKIQNI